jgi:hypothetical protein
MNNITISISYDQGGVGGRGGGGGYTVQFCYNAPSGQRIQEVLHPHVCLSVYRFRCVREAPPSPPLPASATYFILIKIDSDTD